MDVDLAKLCSSIQRSRLALRRFREERKDAVRQYVGNHWSDWGAEEKIPFNLISLYMSVVPRNLIAKNPRVMLSVFDRQHKAAVSIMERWANRKLDQMNFAGTMEKCVVDAQFSIGICKVGIASPADAAIASWKMQAGEPFFESVDLDDLVFDMHVRDLDEVGYIGHRFRVPLEVVRDSKIYSRSRKLLEPSQDALYNVEGDERISVIGRSMYAGDWEDFEDFVDLWEVYVPRHRLVYTLADDHLVGPSAQGAGSVVEPLRVQRWIGPDCGPYHMLGYRRVPGNAMPKGPIQDLIDLHLDVNNIYRKNSRQAQRAKDVTFVQGGAMEDGSRVQQANDGDILRVDNPERIKQVAGMGPNQAILQYGVHLKDLFMLLGGNLEMLGGLAPQSKTLGQDQILAQNASGQIADMQKTTVTFVSDVISSLCWYWWHDPVRTMTVNHSVPGMPEISIVRKLAPQQRQARFEDIDIKVDPYSLQNQTPQSKMAALNQVVQTIVMPMMQLLQQQGIAFDINAYLQKVASYLDMPDLSEIITIQDPPQQDSKTSGESGPSMQAPTERTYTRRSIGGDTPKNREQTMLQGMDGLATNGQRNGQMNGQMAGA